MKMMQCGVFALDFLLLCVCFFVCGAVGSLECVQLDHLADTAPLMQG